MMLLSLLMACADPPVRRGEPARQLGEARVLATTPDWTVDGDEADDSFGLAVAGAGDVNGDGYDDVLISAPMAASAGEVRLFVGSPTGPAEAATLTGDAANARFGVIAALGDLNADGYDDFAVGAPRASFTGVGGEITIYHGGASEPTPAQVLGGGDSYDSFGWALDAGDINGDGAVDLVTGAPLATTNGDTTGVARVLLSDGAVFLDSTGGFYGAPDDRTGYSVSAGGDVDGDGYGDLAFGAPMADGGAIGSGKAFVYYGDLNWPNTAFSTNLAGAAIDGWFGWSVDLAGDIDGDGFTDVVIGAPFEDSADADAGCAHLFYGASSGIALRADWSFCGDAADQALGAELHGGGDINRDGFDELLIASPFADAELGRALIFAGGASGLSSAPDLTLYGTVPVGNFGASVDGAGDTNGDGYGELLIGQPGVSVIGQAHLFGLSVDADSDGVFAALDCDDQDATVYPGAPDVCDGLDNDCDQITDEGEDERCDDIDNDCDQSIDEGAAIGASTWYTDGDSDGYGDPGGSVLACVQPSGRVSDDTDCDDGAAEVYPGAPETCDLRDEDCDGSIDEEATDARPWYTDGDGDGWGLASEVLVHCEEPAGKSAMAGDCDDANAAVFPGAVEQPGDGLDNDCDGAQALVKLGGGCAGCDGGGGLGAGLLGGLLALGRRKNLPDRRDVGHAVSEA